LRVLVTGGAGFVGSALALRLRREGAEVTVLDNLRRRGSEFSLAALATAGVRFQHGDLRQRGDVESCGPFDLLLDCAAEPSVLAGTGSGTRYMVESNLGGTLEALEAARVQGAGVLFLSTSRVYPYDRLGALPMAEGATRFTPVLPDGGVPGLSHAGISEEFPLSGIRTVYGATKLASELLIAEYGATHSLPWIVNRCGVIAGPGQWGKVDQGFVPLWMARHLWGGELSYIGYGGSGRQVRDLLHIDDLSDLIALQVAALHDLSGSTFNVGGGSERSLSLVELTERCRELTGRSLSIASESDTRPGDLPWVVMDQRALTYRTGWTPQRGLDTLLKELLAWLRAAPPAARELLSR